MDDLPIWVYLLGAVLTSGILSALVSWRVALVAAAKQADATMKAARDQADAVIEAAEKSATALIESARKQSLETEMLRLRHQIVGHRYRRWRSVADRMWDIAMGNVDETPSPRKMLLTAFDLVYSSLLVGGPEEYTRTGDTALAFLGEWQKISAQYVKEHGPQSPMTAIDVLDITMPLLNFAMLMDWAAEKRLERRLSEPLSDIPLRIDEIMRKMKDLEA